MHSAWFLEAGIECLCLFGWNGIFCELQDKYIQEVALGYNFAGSKYGLSSYLKYSSFTGISHQINIRLVAINFKFRNLIILIYI